MSAQTFERGGLSGALPGPRPTRVEALRAGWGLACTAAFTLACAVYVVVRYAAFGRRAPRPAQKRS